VAFDGGVREGAVLLSIKSTVPSSFFFITEKKGDVKK